MTPDDNRHEWSHDDKRGALPHIRRTLNELRDLKVAHVPCTRCRTARASTLVDGPQYRALCPSCAAAWHQLSPIAKRQARLARSTR